MDEIAVGKTAKQPAKDKGPARLAVVFVAAGLAVLLAALVWFPPLWQRGFAPVSPAPFKQDVSDVINLNTAPLEELQLLPGIGGQKAAAIIAYREEICPFASVEELTQVPGIGEKTLEALRAYICV